LFFDFTLSFYRPSLSTDAIIGITIGIFIILFSVQRFGTSSVSLFFSPIICLWMFGLAANGIQAISYAPEIFKAFNPWEGILNNRKVLFLLSFSFLSF